MSIGKLAAQSALKDPKGGLTAAGRAHFKRTEGANLKPGVKGPADTPEKMRRKGSFLSRMFGPGAPGAMTRDNGEPSRRALSARAWGEPVPKNDSDRAALYAKGQRLLERYKNQKEGAEAPPWEQENPKKKSKELSDAQKAEAKRRARAAGRPYPNLVDNMAVTKKAFDFSDDMPAELRNMINKEVERRTPQAPIYPKTAFDQGYSAALSKFAAELTSKGRAQVKSFAIPETKKYPIHDAAHARNALARVSQFGTAEEKARVRAAVKSKYPGISQE
jgi:hypothetical protein